MITRRHAEELTKLPSLVDPDKKDLVIAWNTVHAPEEVYFSTMLALLGFLRDEPNATHTIHRNSDQNPFIKTTNDEVWRRRVCYAEWKRKNDANPIGFPALTVSLCNHFRRHGSIFARKFGENTITVDQWKEVISSAIPLSILKREQMSQSEGTLAPSTLEVNSPELDKNVLINSDIPISCQNSTIEVLVDDCPPMKKLKSSHDHDTVTDTTSISESPSPL